MKKISILFLVTIVIYLLNFSACKKVPLAKKDPVEVKDTIPTKDSIPVMDSVSLIDSLIKPDSLLVMDTTTGCIIFGISKPFFVYSFPVWHPGSELLGFNYVPVTGTKKYGLPPCVYVDPIFNFDSAGFYLMNKDRTGLKRVTNYQIEDPAWSPDGNWLAFSLGKQIYKLRYTGSGFDTANLIQLTTRANNFHPSWTANSDTLYYESNAKIPDGITNHCIWKMHANGNGKQLIAQDKDQRHLRQPYIGADNLIYYVGPGGRIFSMNKDGTNQVPFTKSDGYGGRPRYWQGKVFHEADAIFVSNSLSDHTIKLASPAITYNISKTGEIVYCRTDHFYPATYLKERGTLWIMNADGSNHRQLTFNNF